MDADSNSILSEEAKNVNFFQDFMLFLRFLEKQPIKRTLTGNISLANITELLKQFKEQERIEEYKKFGWSLRREQELDFLEQIKTIAEVMFLIYKRKGLLLISQNGRGFINKLDPIHQYQEIVLHFWYKTNWGYFSIGRVVNDYTLAEFLQYHQAEIWQTLLKSGPRWIDYKKFCYWLYNHLHLEKYIFHEYGDLEHELLFEINLTLFRRNLVRLGCVEVVEEVYEHEWHKEIVKFRPTPLGFYLFHKALFENYL